jgi:hypothetical protein
MTERVGQQRRLLQIRQETALGLVIGVAHVVAVQHAFAGDGAASSHDLSSSLLE